MVLETALVASLNLFPRRTIDDAADLCSVENAATLDELSRSLALGHVDFALVGLPRIFFRNLDLGGELLPSWGNGCWELSFGLGCLSPLGAQPKPADR